MNAERWQTLLASEARRANVPGAALAISRGEERIELAHGLLSMETGVEASPGAVFQVASVTKAWTAAAALQLVDDGRIGLDAPVVDVLPELRLGDPGAACAITLRHLLAHTSGLDGDLFTDTGRGGDCIERYVEQLAGVGQTHAVGRAWSYCNAGYMVAGRIIERLTGSTWDEALRMRLFAPLGLTRTVTLPEEALRFRLAVGHHVVDGQPRTVPPSHVPRSNGPAGGILSSAGDQLTFAQTLLRGGAPILRSASAEAMQAQQVAIGADGSGWGLGLLRRQWDGHVLVGHDGAGMGQAAFLRMLPDHDIAFALLTNVAPLTALPLFSALWRTACEELAGVRLPPAPAPPRQPPSIEPDRYAGVYERTRLRTEIVERDGELLLRRIVLAPLAGLDQHDVQEWPLVATGEDRFLARPPGSDAWVPVVFDRFQDGTPYVHYLMRANPKTA